MTDSFKQYGFTSNVTDFVCPGWASGGYTWKCQAPNACATETSTNKQYCCDAGDVCWTTSSVCATGGSTFTCTSSGSTWCCLTDKEGCTQAPGQTNICWSLDHDTLNNISYSVLNQAYSSLSSAQPLASFYSFDPLELNAQTQTALTQRQSTSTQTQSTSTQTANPPHSTGHTNNSVSSISKGAIAGIVIGILASIAIACLATYFLVRRRQKKQHKLAQPATPGTEPKYTQPAQEYQGHPGIMPQEMPTGNKEASELP